MAAIDTVPDVDGQDIALSADGTRLAAGTSVHGIMRPLGIYDAQTGRRLVELKGLCSFDLLGPPEKPGPGCKAFPETPFGTWPFSMEFSPNGRYLAELDVGIAVWSAGTGESMMTMETEGQPWSAIFTPDSTELLVSTADGELMAISTETWNVTRRERIDESVDSRISLTGFLPDGKTLIGVSGTGGSGGGSLHRIDVATLKVLSSNRAHDGAPKASRLSDDGKLIVTGAADGVVRVWDAATGTLLHEPPSDCRRRASRSLTTTVSPLRHRQAGSSSSVSTRRPCSAQSGLRSSAASPLRNASASTSTITARRLTSLAARRRSRVEPRAPRAGPGGAARGAGARTAVQGGPRRVLYHPPGPVAQRQSN